MRSFIGDVMRFAGLLLIVGVAWVIILIAGKADAERINGLLAAAEYELIEPPPVTDSLLAYQSQTGMIGEEEGRPWKSLIALVVTAVSLTGGMVLYLLIGPDGLNGLARQLRLARRGQPSRGQVAPQLPKIESVTPSPSPAPTQPERKALPGGNQWLLPPGE